MRGRGRVASWFGPVLAVFLPVVAAVMAVDPRGDFPLDDDWNFALTTWHFAKTGLLRFSRFTAMTLRAQVLWGALWTKLFGESFTVLRCSTLLLFGAAIFLILDLLRRAGVPAPRRWLATLCFAFHPLIFWSAFTYMTHIPFVFFSVLAMWGFYRGLKEERFDLFCWGSLAVIASYFVRQTGIVNALPPLFVLWRRHRENEVVRWKWRLMAVAPLISFLLLFAGGALTGYPGQISEHFLVWQVPLVDLPLQVGRVAWNFIFFTFQMGSLFLFPLALPLLWRRPRSRVSSAFTAALVAAFVVGAVNLLGKGFSIPYWSALPGLEVHPGNVFVNLGLGPLTLRDTWTLDLPYPFALGQGARNLLSIFAAILGALTLVSVVETLTLPEGRRNVLLSLTSVHVVFATLALLASGIWFDRYTIDATWSLVLLLTLLIAWTRKTFVVSALALALVAFFSVGAVQEYLSWNRARWQGVAFLRERGVKIEQMDGGYEVNQYLIGGFDGPILLRKSGFSVVDDEYVLSFSEMTRYRRFAAFPYRGFFGLRRGLVYVSRRTGPPRPGREVP